MLYMLSCCNTEKSLTTLPIELICHIIFFITDKKTLKSFIETCKLFYEIISDSRVYSKEFIKELIYYNNSNQIFCCIIYNYRGKQIGTIYYNRDNKINSTYSNNNNVSIIITYRDNGTICNRNITNYNNYKQEDNYK